MDKNENVKWFLNMNVEHRIIFTTDENCSPDMLELKRQIAIFIEHKTDVGITSYYALGSEHGDDVMALMINIQKVKQYLKPGDIGVYVESQMIDTTEINYAMGNF